MPQTNCLRVRPKSKKVQNVVFQVMSVAPDKLLKGGRFAAEKPKKVQNVVFQVMSVAPDNLLKGGRNAEKGTERFYFLVPRIREIIQSKEFLKIESSPRKSAQIAYKISFS